MRSAATDAEDAIFAPPFELDLPDAVEIPPVEITEFRHGPGIVLVSQASASPAKEKKALRHPQGLGFDWG